MKLDTYLDLYYCVVDDSECDDSCYNSIIELAVRFIYFLPTLNTLALYLALAFKSVMEAASCISGNSIVLGHVTIAW